MRRFRSLKSAIDSQRSVFDMQLIMMAVLAVAAVGVVLIQWLFPSFFVYPYFAWGGWNSVMRFWPLFAWGGGLTLLLLIKRSKRWPIRLKENGQLLQWEVLTSVTAGVWEEFAFRWAFICYAMISIVFFNWVLSSLVGWGIAAVALVAAGFFWHEDEKAGAVIALVAAVAASAFALYAQPIIWFYEILVWIMNYTTLTLMEQVLYDKRLPLFVLGAALANIWFRNGHKYQGLLGLVNSWYCGMVFLYATVTYGLWTAVVVHAVYDILIGVVRFAVEQLRQARQTGKLPRVKKAA